MSKTVISVENLTKQYDLGVIGTGTLSRDLNRWWARVRHLPDPYTRIGQQDAFARIGESILALDDVSFTVNQGEALGIIGRNGAGKSTLLKILSRVTAPSSGVVKVRGRIGSLLEVGTGFHPELTGRENVYLNGAILGMKKDEVTRKFDEIVAFSGVEKFIDTPVKRYSSGMYVRLAFAVAAHLDPEILIVDEVLAVGDAEFQKKCLGKMGDVAGEGRTVLFVSHNMAAIQALCQNSLLLSEGSIKIVGHTDDVISQYISHVKFSDNCEVDLTDHQGRMYSKEKAIKKVWLKNGNEDLTTTFRMGDKLLVYFEFESSGKLEFPAFGFGIEDRQLRRIFSLNNYLVPNAGNHITDINHGVAVLSLPNVPLLPGKYFISISIFEKNTGYVDFVGQAISFEVIASDVYKSGRIPDENHGVIFVSGNISILL